LHARDTKKKITAQGSDSFGKIGKYELKQSWLNQFMTKRSRFHHKPKRGNTHQCDHPFAEGDERDTFCVHDFLVLMVSNVFLQIQRFDPSTNQGISWFHNFDIELFLAAKRVFVINETIVIGPTPPGTGVIKEHLGATPV
jgi:hypothetical protein